MSETVQISSRDEYTKSNPSGMVNLGTAVNSLCESEISSRLSRGDLWQHQPAWQHYFGLNGTPDLLRVTAHFLQQRLAQVVLIYCNVGGMTFLGSTSEL